jgi:pyruvate/2-oxoglutarate/acetoin dehydrogenase E1 component/TPP-dependent pyruvate/acetoin dehydrogenase alpha subunit
VFFLFFANTNVINNTFLFSNKFQISVKLLLKEKNNRSKLNLANEQMLCYLLYLWDSYCANTKLSNFYYYMLDTSLINSYFASEEVRDVEFINEVLNDFWICCVSREASLTGRREVLTGKAKFGILGDGKEVPQVAMAKAFKKGDWRSGYYRDQTFMFAMGLLTVEQYFGQLYADTENDPFSGGRQMNSHYASRLIDEEGNWLDHVNSYNISSDISCTGGQMARGLGHAFASKKYREQLDNDQNFSDNGNEVCFCTIGDASTSEGVFWEAVNAACVEQVPLAISVWDDGYGISVPKQLQTTKSSISRALAGFQDNEDGPGMDIYVCKAYDYPALVEMYERGIKRVRTEHIPALFHVEDCTQPQGHSTSGSHERYKSPERLAWESEFDAIKKMGEWMVESEIATEETVLEIREQAKKYVRACKNRAWASYQDRCALLRRKFLQLFPSEDILLNYEEISALKLELERHQSITSSEIVKIARKLYFIMRREGLSDFQPIKEWIDLQYEKAHEDYHTHLYDQSDHSALKVPVIRPSYSEDSKKVNGYQVLQNYFDTLLSRDPRVIAFGEDVGEIGDVNQGFAGLQEKYGKTRVFDMGIREWTIMGQAIGAAMRGLRPIAEIQYLDYLIYGFQPLTDDLSTLRYRSDGMQCAPAIIRTRGHRLEGIWHAGSPLSILINGLRGMFVCVPRNMVQAVGMYNTLMNSNDPGIVIECLNGYRLKEIQPDNIGTYTVPLGLPEVLQTGEDLTLVTYGSCVRIAQEAMSLLAKMDISVELIDVQTLLPFDLEGVIINSLRKTNRIVFLDEDVPGGATAYMMQKVLEESSGYRLLDSSPVTITAKEHRTPFGSDGDYFSKPNAEDVYERIMQLMHEVHPEWYSI